MFRLATAAAATFAVVALAWTVRVRNAFLEPLGAEDALGSTNLQDFHVGVVSVGLLLGFVVACALAATVSVIAPVQIISGAIFAIAELDRPDLLSNKRTGRLLVQMFRPVQGPRRTRWYLQPGAYLAGIFGFGSIAFTVGYFDTAIPRVAAEQAQIVMTGRPISAPNIDGFRPADYSAHWVRLVSSQSASLPEIANDCLLILGEEGDTYYLFDAGGEPRTSPTSTIASTSPGLVAFIPPPGVQVIVLANDADQADSPSDTPCYRFTQSHPPPLSPAEPSVANVPPARVTMTLWFSIYLMATLAVLVLLLMAAGKPGGKFSPEFDATNGSLHEFFEVKARATLASRQSRTVALVAVFGLVCNCLLFSCGLVITFTGTDLLVPWIAAWLLTSAGCMAWLWREEERLATGQPA